MEFTPRKQKILSAIVKSYIASGEPVGSKLIAQEIGVSSATIRNEMAELIEMGLLEQPHTSAGRIPSQRGFRAYIDSFMEPTPLPSDLKAYLDSVLSPGAYDREKLLHRAGEAIAGATRYASIVSEPGGKAARISAVQFVQISRRTAMLILLSSAGTMESRIFHCDFDLSSEIMRIFFRVFNEKVAGKPLSEVTPAFIQTLGVSLGELTLLMSSALTAFLEAALETMKADVILSGQMNLLFYPEFTPGNVRKIHDVLKNPESASSFLLGKAGRANISIGYEIGRSEFSQTSIVSCRYLIGGFDAGGVGVVGPIRMNYSLVSASVEYVANAVSNMLTFLMKES